jgi:hypothetical protein
MAPKISILFSKNTSWDLFYELQKKKIPASRNAKSKFYTSFSFAGTKKITMNGELSLYQNL